MAVRLVLSALAQEQAELRRRLGVGRQALVRVDEGLWLGVTGDGPIRADAGLRRHLNELASFSASASSSASASERPAVVRIVVIGLGGGLSPGMESGRLVEGRRVVGAEGGVALELDALNAPGASGATLVSAPRIVSTSREKRALWQRVGAPDPAVVDLESLAYAKVAQKAGVPLSVLRIVSDGDDEDLPSEIAASSGDDGSVRQWQVALRAAVNPRVWAPLASLKSRLDRAGVQLAEAVLQTLSDGRPLQGS